MFVRGKLTRQRGRDPRALTYAVLDLETTGLDPARGARVCEVAVVRLRGDGTVLDEYATLVDPRQPIPADLPHEITSTDVRGAPTFEQVAGDLLAYLADAIVVSHHLDFEERFLIAEFGRLGVSVQGVPGLCTLVTARTQLDRWGYRLDEIASLITGEWPVARHSALGDARALATVLTKLLTAAPQPLHWVGPSPVPPPNLPRTGMIAPRATWLRKGSEGWLATLTARLPLMASPPPPRPEGLRDYRALLTHALADGRIVGEEAQQLAVVAARAGLTQTTARQVHEEFLADARARAEADGVVTSAELRELQRAAKELAASHLIGDLVEAAAADRARVNGPLKGWRILPVGDSAAVTEVVDYAVEHGGRVAVNLTKTVRFVVNDGAGVSDPRIAKAQSLGIEVVSPDQARKLLEQEVARSGQKLFADPTGARVADRISAERAAEARASRPEWHQCWRPRELTPAEYHTRFVQRHEDWDDWDDEDDDAGYAEVGITVASPASRPVQTATAQRQGSGCLSAVILIAVLLAGVVELARQVVT